MQMVCALLIFQDPDLPAPLSRLSPWLDWLAVPADELHASLAAQTHRRFIKTHTPLDGVPIEQGTSYIVVARHPLDMAVSLYHQGNNIDREKLRQLTGAPPPQGSPPARLPLHGRAILHQEALPLLTVQAGRPLPQPVPVCGAHII